MNPGVGDGGLALPNQLVELDVLLEPTEPCSAGGFVGDAEVGSTAGDVVAGGGSAYGPVQYHAAVAAVDVEGDVGVLP